MSKDLMNKYYKTIQIGCSQETELFQLLFQDGDKFWTGTVPGLYLGVFGLQDDRVYVKDSRGILPKWYICKDVVRETSPTLIDGNLETPVASGVLVEIKFISGFTPGLLLKFVGRENSNCKDVIRFVESLFRKIQSVTDLKVIEDGSLQSEIDKPSDEPWEIIPDIGSDRKIVQLWRKRETAAQIGYITGLTSRTVTNKISQLRKLYGRNVVPYKKTTKAPENE